MDNSEILTVNGLCKKYPAFELKNITFGLKRGRITGFIGRNGAGKTTTLKSLLNFVHPDTGEIRFFGESFAENENDIKARIGFVTGGMGCYLKSRVKAITDVTRRFYPEWDENAYRKFMELFKLDESKTTSQLSEGMKVKYSLALALSHNAELLILDEPTSGLDPVSRDELLDVFNSLVLDHGATIFFSTHITSDLDKCADDIVYIKNGEISDLGEMKAFVSSYRAVILTDDEYFTLGDGESKAKLIGLKKEKNGYSAIVKAGDCTALKGMTVGECDLEKIMIHKEKD